MYKLNYYVNNQALRMLYYNLKTHEHGMGLLPGEEHLHVIYSQYRYKLLTNKVATIYNTQKILQLKDILVYAM